MQTFHFKMQDGSEYEVDELDYNNLCGRISNGRYNGYYTVRGKINTGMRFAFQYFMIVKATGDPEKKDEPVRNIDVNKHKPQPVGKVEEKPKGCPHDWNNTEHWEYVKKNINGKLQYRKRCLECGKVSSLIKPREVEVAMEAEDKTLDDVIDNT